MPLWTNTPETVQGVRDMCADVCMVKTAPECGFAVMCRVCGHALRGCAGAHTRTHAHTRTRPHAPAYVPAHPAHYAHTIHINNLLNYFKSTS